MATLRRRIYFYDIAFVGYDGDESFELDPVPIMREIENLPIAEPVWGPSSRYSPLPDAGEDSLLMEVTGRVRGQIRGVFAVKRRSGIPRLERSGSYRDLLLAAEEGLAEIRHFVLWPNRGLLGIEVNGRGPTTSRFRDYLVDKGEDVGLDDVQLRMRLAEDQFDILERSDRISSATVEVVRERLDTIGALDEGLESALDQIAESTNARSLRLELRLGDRRRDATLELPWRTKVRDFLSNHEQREAIENMKVQAFDETLGHMRTVDLLEDQFVGHEEVVEVRSGVVDSDGMYRAIARSARQVPGIA